MADNFNRRLRARSAFTVNNVRGRPVRMAKLRGPRYSGQLRELMGTIDSMIAVLEEVRTLPQRVTAKVYDSIMQSENMPEYTGTYEGAIQVLYNEDGSMGVVYMSIESLLASAEEHIEVVENPEGSGGGSSMTPHDYASGKANPTKAPGGQWDIVGPYDFNPPYPVRLEAIGSPSYDSGQGIWRAALLQAMGLFNEEINALRSSLGG